MKRWTRKRVVGTALLVFLVGIVVVLALHPYAHALLRSKSQFIVHPASAHVFYEPGAKENADQIASLLPEAIHAIEIFHDLPFEEQFNVYVCATQESHNAYSATSPLVPIRGMALRGDVYIAPSAFSFHGVDTHRGTLLHELAHLHLSQRLGFVERNRLPVWFSEGEADVVAQTGGEGIDTTEAIEAILAGNHFALKRDKNLFDSINDEAPGIGPRMYHLQCKMFVSFLRQYQPGALTSLLRGIQQGDSFIDSFEKAYGQTPEQMWDRFVSSLSAARKPA